MPLKEKIPVIDDRRYADIRAEALTRIPRYVPEWTDNNESDPGIALLELFAWMSDLLMYRMAKVPDLNYIKFLELVGIELAPAQPARAEITFPVRESCDESSVIVPARTQVAAEEPDDDGPIVFETDQALVALAAKLDAVQSFDGYSYSDLAEANDEASEEFHPLGPLAGAGSALLLGFDYDGDFPDVELNIAFWSIEGDATESQTPCGASALYSPATLQWEFWNGKEWQSLSLLKDETLAFTHSGHVYLKAVPKGQMIRAQIGTVSEDRYWIRARVVEEEYEEAPSLLAVRINTVAAQQAETVESEVLGGSDGSRDQVVTIRSTPILAGSLNLEVDDGDGFKSWTEVDDFFASGPDDPHYVLNRTSGEIRFGDGDKGRIPVANKDKPGSSIVAREYRFGGGQRGNLSADSLTSLLTSVTGIDANAVTNVFATHGGSDEESLEDACDRAPQTLKSRNRAVTAEDFELLALRSTNIKRAKALPLHHPKFPGVEVPGVVSVIVVPDVEGTQPMPSEATLRTVCAYLDARRLLTTEIYVVKPTYKTVRVTVDLFAKDDADLAELKNEIETFLLSYFHPLTGGEDGRGWPFGGDIYYSRVYHHLFTDDVKRVGRLVIAVDGDVCPECQDIHIDDGVLLTSTEHEIEVCYDHSE